MRYLWMVSLLIVTLLGNVFYAFQDVGFFHRQFVQLGSYERQENVMDETKVLMRYWYNDDVLVVSDVYTQAEKEHLHDVKKLLVVLWYMFLAVSLWLLSLSFWSYRRWFFSDPGSFTAPQGHFLANAHGAFRMTTILFGLFTLCVLAVGWFAWDWLFDLFHRTFFVDNWLFAADSFLIQSYPWEFFRNAMVAVLVRSFGMMLLIWAVLWAIIKKPRRA